MLDELVVRNLGVLEEARIEPGPGLTVVTGETGAGKTMLLGALRLLLGQAADSDLVGPFGEEASAEGRFVDADGRELGVGRRLTRNGRSRAYIDGSVASAATLDQATAGLVEVVGQHDHLSLTRPAEVRALIDRLLDDAGREALERYRRTWEERRRLAADQEALGGDRGALERELDLVTFQADEIASARITPGEDAELEARLGRLRNVEELREVLAAGFGSLDGARDRLGAAVAALRRAAALDPSLETMAAEVADLEGRLGDVALDAGRVAEDLEADPAALEEAESRLRRLTDLKRKYGADLEDVVSFGAKAAARAEEIRSLLGRAERLGVEIAEADRRLREFGVGLREARARAAERLATEAVAHLEELGFSTPLVQASVEEAEPAAHGADVSSLLFASDRRLAPGEIGRVASGGELSRLVLALRLAGGAGDVATLVFDEIDAGVGGSTALALGRKLAGLAEGRQVLCVTHLPQVAAFADTHYVVRRDESRATAERVDGEARLEELARMLAGLPESERGKDAAKELLSIANRG